jgi:hypothetical protein
VAGCLASTARDAAVMRLEAVTNHP